MAEETTGRVSLPYLRRWRRKRFKTLRTLEVDSGVSRNTIINLELGRRQANYDTLGKLARGLGITPEQLVNVDPDAPQP